MQKAVSAADANRKLSELLRTVRNGHSYVVTSHGKPVAKIMPIEFRYDLLNVHDGSFGGGQLAVLRLGLLQDGDVGIGVLLESEARTASQRRERRVQCRRLWESQGKSWLSVLPLCES